MRLRPHSFYLDSWRDDTSILVFTLVYNLQDTSDALSYNVRLQVYTDDSVTVALRDYRRTSGK